MSSRKISSSLYTSSQEFQNDQNSNHSNIKQQETVKSFSKSGSGKLYHYKSSKAFQSIDTESSEYKRLKKEKRALSQYIITLQQGTRKALEEKQQQLQELHKSYQQYSFIKQSVQKEIEQYQQQILQLQYQLELISYQLKEERELYRRQIQEKQSIVEYLTEQLTQLSQQIEEYNHRNAEIFQKIQEEEKKLVEFKMELQEIQNNLLMISRNKWIHSNEKQTSSCMKKSYVKTRKNSQQILRNQLSEYIENHRQYISEIKLEYEQKIDYLIKEIEESKIIPQYSSVFNENSVQKNIALHDSIYSLPINPSQKTSFQELQMSNSQNKFILQKMEHSSQQILNTQQKIDLNQQDTTNQTQQEKRLMTTRQVSQFIAGVLIGFLSFSIFSKFGKNPI